MNKCVYTGCVHNSKRTEDWALEFIESQCLNGQGLCEKGKSMNTLISLCMENIPTKEKVE